MIALNFNKLLGIIFLIIIFIFFTVSIHPIDWGIKGGLVISKLDSEVTITDSSSIKYRIFGLLGIMSVIDLYEKLDIQAEILYVPKGGEYIELPAPSLSDPEEEGPLMDIKTFLDVIEIPLILKYNFYNKFKLYGGISFNYVIKAYSINDYSNYNTDMSEYFQKIGFGINIGAQYDLDNVQFDIRYQKGITNYYKIENTSSWENDLKLDSLFFTIGYLF